MRKKTKAILSVGLLPILTAALFFSPVAGTKASAAGAEVATGIDVSKYQGGINWQQVKAAGVRFAMIRVGTTKKGLDEQFVNNINGANAAGIRTGIYIYSYATTPEAAAAEANQVLAWIAPYQVSFPVAIDIEDSSQKGLSAGQLQAIADTFCGILNSNGYETMVYANRNWFRDRMPNVAAPKWIAQYGNALEYGGDYAMWQSSSNGQYPGIAGRVDVNHLYTDYFSRIIPEGFNNVGGNTFYYSNYRKQFGWLNLAGQRYHTDPNGVVQTGWFQDESGVFFLDPGAGGLAKTGFADIEGGHYYFDENGVKRTGLLNLGGTIYYTDPNGVCQRGFVDLEDGKHYFDEQYVMRTGLTQIGDKLYLFAPNGVMQTGMQALENGKYMFGADGVAISGWFSNEQGQRFFFAPDTHTAMVGLQNIENANYLFGPDGVMVTGWSGNLPDKFYFGPDGKMVTGWNDIEGRRFYFGADGKLVVGLAGLQDGVYYLDPADGHQVVGWVQLPDGWHYFDANNGKMLANVSAPLDNVPCTFDKNGILVDPAGWTPGTPAPVAEPAPEAAAEASSQAPAAPAAKPAG
ncbi:GH25 family lysozyme [Butyrivibrio sp. INlla21]|uniref:GH25 family lysozyme n=1 Tax=Butyrivibrio sp. INlla21 TaxID=1520811 RepID=UPI0008E50D60|nr:GH25 family lysozyme [Butyrivibrio sp. INlla21]SFV04870.1 Putative cell wall binding repeat-containing protein [Butyrivibrio sp. INlla21]